MRDSGHETLLKDLRLKVPAAVDRGMPRKEVAEVFRVWAPTAKRFYWSDIGLWRLLIGKPRSTCSQARLR